MQVILLLPPCNWKKQSKLSVSYLSFRTVQQKTSEKRTTSLQGTNVPSPMCPLFGGFIVKTVRMDLSWDHFNSSLQAKHTFDLKNSNFGYAGFQEKFDTPPLKQTKTAWAQFQKNQLTPYKTRYAFSRSPPGQGVMPTNLLPVIAPRMEPSYTHSR